jgi:hypothetical protein
VNIKIKIPCVLAYTANIYSDSTKLSEAIMTETREMINYFDENNYKIIEKVDYEIIYYIFPIDNIQQLRETISSFKKIK